MGKSNPKSYTLSSMTQVDLEEIYIYTLLRFGINQADTYVTSFHETFNKIASNPYLGRTRSGYSNNLLSFKYQSHVIFYVISGHGIRIQRVLHHSREYKRHL